MSAEGMGAAIPLLPALCSGWAAAAGLLGPLAARDRSQAGGVGGGRLLAGWRGWDAVRAADDFRHIEAWVAGVRHPSLPTRTPRRPQPSCSSLALPVATVTLQAGAGKKKKKKRHPNLESLAKSPSPSLVPTDRCVYVGDMIPGISEVLTFSGWLVFCTSACLPGCIYYSCPCAASGGCLVVLHEQISFPSAGSSRSAAAAGLPLPSCLMSFPIIYPAPSLQREIYFLYSYVMCVWEKSPGRRAFIAHSFLL